MMQRALAPIQRLQRKAAEQGVASLWEPDGGARAYRYYLAAGCAVACATGVMLILRGVLGVFNVALLYLLLALALGLVAGPGPAAMAAVLCFLAFDFFFIPPFYTFTVDQAYHVLTLFAFLGVALVTSQLVARVRERTEDAIREQHRAALLYELNAALVSDVTLDAILDAIVAQVVSVYGAEGCRILVPRDPDDLLLRARFPSDLSEEISRENRVMALWAIEHRAPVGRKRIGHRVHLPHRTGNQGTVALPHRGPDMLYLPVATKERVIGVLEVIGKRGGGRFGEEDERLLISFADQAALALERTRLAEEASLGAVRAQSDELKSALLAAVSHDLRTPLATIKASVTSLLDPTVAWGEISRTEFLEAIDEETDRLTLLVGNMLDLSRIEGGVLRPEKAWYDVAELIEDVENRLAGLFAGTRLTTEIEPSLPLVCFDFVQIGQVLMNLGENTVKYTSPGTAITLSAHRLAGAIRIAVSDVGPGIPATRLPHVFEKFYRADPTGRVRGAGIGLAISKGLVEAHGGQIWAESREGAGTTIMFTLPLQLDATS
jgi:two-component system sensor histidine kinase KdpD